MTLTPLCWSRQPLRPTAFMPLLLRLTIVLASLLPALADAEQVRVFVAGAAKAGVEALLPGFGHTDGDTIQATTLPVRCATACSKARSPTWWFCPMLLSTRSQFED
jgi:hypothetical protein